MSEKHYVVPVLKENDQTWDLISGRTQPLACLYDNYGNLKDCVFGRTTAPEIGEFYVFHSLEKEVAEQVRESLTREQRLTVLPIVEYSN